jgi:Domain of unknown function (DUF6265)
MRLSLLLAVALATTTVAAQTATPPGPGATESKAQDAPTLASLSWLEGCWRGTAGPREFREHWMPLQGAMMIGVSQTIEKGATQSYEFLRLEPRQGGVFYVASPAGKPETAFRYEGETVDKTADRNDSVFTFVNPKQEFPQMITYRRGTEGWLYATVEGKVGGAERKATYPMRRIDCESGDFIRH